MPQREIDIRAKWPYTVGPLMDNFWLKLPKPIAVLAPMEDVTDTVFRRLIGSCGRPDVFFTEFTSTDGMFSPGRDAVIKRLEFTQEERPLVAQIWGNNPELYFKAGKDIAEMGFDGLDINMGCPVAKIIKQGHCSGLIQNKPLAKELVLAAMEGAGKVPVSVKTRIGYREIETEEWAGFLLELNPAALTIHGRTAKQLSKVPANWDEIGKVAALRKSMGSKTVIIGNGDVQSREEIELKHQQHGVDGVMVGRGIFHNPFLFAKSGTTHISQLSFEQKLQMLLSHTKSYTDRWGVRHFGVMKKFFKIYIRDFHGATELREKLMHTNSYEEVESILNELRN